MKMAVHSTEWFPYQYFFVYFWFALNATKIIQGNKNVKHIKCTF